jgi:dihydrofolate reductase
MPSTKFQIAVSLDGYAAGPDPSEEEPLGVGGEALHERIIENAAWRKSHGYEGGEVNASTPVIEDWGTGFGAVLMGRGMFGPPNGGPWGEDPWQGWWGDSPPFHKPVFVLTHHDRDPLTLDDTTFHFVSDGIDSALEQARSAAGDQDVHVAGGADVIQQALAAGQIEEFELHVAPILLGGGRRLLENVGDLEVEQERVIEAPGITHLKYRVVK